MQPVFECKVGPHGLDPEDISTINCILQKGGMCILPSDSSYILTGRINVPGIAYDIDKLLERDHMAMSLCFNSVEQVQTMTELSNLASSFIKRFIPGGLTFIARPTSKSHIMGFLNRINVYDGTIGIRISESLAETQMAKAFPTPSTPIRDKDLKEISDADEALKIVSYQMIKKQRIRDLVLIRGDVLHPGLLSTVVKEIEKDGYLTIEILRKGIIPVEEIRQAARDCFYDEIIVPD